jgi:P pilus assembly chaperone PapD
MKFLMKILFVMIFGLPSFTLLAGVIVGGTRVVYDASKREASLSVRNTDNTPYLIQSWVDANGPTGTVKAGKTAFLVTPPVFRLEAGDENLLRIILTAENFPSDRESIFWLNVKAIPASVKTNKNILQISIKSRMKLFYRPGGLDPRPEDSFSTITFHRQGEKIFVTNPTPYYVTFFSFKLGGVPVKTLNVMLGPKNTTVYDVPKLSSGNQIRWQAINDYGGSSTEIVTALQ